ncbi:hypothetical protein N2152v2_003826 [Parachlorella kessleri]
MAYLADHDHEHDVHFESADAGASKTYPQQAGTIRKNAYIVINNRPCKVADVSTSKTGKHGHAKCHFVGIDIFTGKKYEDLTPSSHNCDVPHVNRTEYTLLDVSDDGFVSLMDEKGNTVDHLTLPKGTDELEKLAVQIREDFATGKELVVAVLSVSGVADKQGTAMWLLQWGRRLLSDSLGQQALARGQAHLEAMGEEMICAVKTVGGA